MPADYQSANDRGPNQPTLDDPPPSPPEKRGKSGPGLGEMSGSPGLMALQGLQQIENGMQLLTTGLPQLGPLIQGMAMMMARLRQAVPQAMAMGGASPLGSSSPMGSPMLTPPPAMTQLPPGLPAPAMGAAPG